MYATTKIVKIADSATISENIPTRPREGRIHSGSVVVGATAAELNGVLLYSYFQSGSSGCFRSQSGRRLRTTGIVAKSYSGGGEVVDHSSVHASHGSFPAGSPERSDRTMLITNMSTAMPWNSAPIDSTKLSVSSPRPG